MKTYNFPFTAILSQKNMKLALILNLIDPQIGGVLLTGNQGTGKSTAVRSLVEILPEIRINEGCKFNCDINDIENYCQDCKENFKKENPQKRIKMPKPLVTLPLGATEEMLIGSLNIEQIIREGKKSIQPGLLAKAHRGILYVDEINLLPDHLVDVLLDVSASKVNIIEREGISLDHPASFILIGSMNPEEGELRPQISDRLGLEVQIFAPKNPKIRAEITRRVVEFNDNPAEFCEKFLSKQEKLKNKIIQAKDFLRKIEIPSKIYKLTSELTIKMGLSSQRADITFIRCARAHAAFSKRNIVKKEDLKASVSLVFQHRLKRFYNEMDKNSLKEKFEEIYSDLII